MAVGMQLRHHLCTSSFSSSVHLHTHHSASHGKYGAAKPGWTTPYGCEQPPAVLRPVHTHLHCVVLHTLEGVCKFAWPRGLLQDSIGWPLPSHCCVFMVSPSAFGDGTMGPQVKSPLSAANCDFMVKRKPTHVAGVIGRGRAAYA